MAPTMERAPAVFISYAHRDNKSPSDEEPGWVSALERDLKINLGQLLGRDPELWRDPRLRGNEEFAGELDDRVREAEAFLCVVSPSYVGSTWCKREFEGFCEAVQGRPAERSRVFKVMPIPVPREQHPDDAKKLGYDFYKKDPESGRIRPLDPSKDPSLKTDYWLKLLDLAQDMCDLLKTVSEEQPAAVEEGPPVFLAETSFDLKDEREEIKRDLKNTGYRVLPDEALPLVAPELEAVVREQLAGCRLSIHLLGTSYGVVPEGSEESVVAILNRVAAECAASGGPQRLVLLPSAEVTDERQKAFLEALQADDRSYENTDLLKNKTIEQLKTRIHECLDAPEEKAAETGDATEAAEGGDPSVYLICDERDLAQCQPVARYLFEHGMNVTVPSFDGKEDQLRADHEENLASCDAVLIYYGEGNDTWQSRKLREVTKSAGYGRQRPLLAKAIYVAEPATPQKGLLMTREATVLNPQEHPDPKVLDVFLTEIENARAGRGA